MRKIIALAAVALAATSTPALAQNVTGTLVINGNVPSKCQVVSGTGVSQTFGTTVDLGDLSAPDGTLRTGISVTSADYADLLARVVCTTANADVTLTATPLAIAGAPAAPAGYTNVIDYTAGVQITEVGGGSGGFVLASDPNALTFPVGRLANNGSGNVDLSATSFTTAAGSILEQGSYTGQVQVVIAPAP